jgi:hypothetical protein
LMRRSTDILSVASATWFKPDRTSRSVSGM